jgi:2-polyprenyl-3-methyl-5-hydroxy-6-metoxy-1,4-benzoquinol methylase
MARKTSTSQSYILGYDEAEHARLEQQAQRLEPATRQALATVGIKEGWRCLDVACGTGANMRLMGPMVGASGQVHGIDLDDVYGSAAARKLNAIGPSIYSFEAFDVMGAGEPQGAPYDLVFTRLLICHMTEPARAVGRLWSWVKPGGTLLTQDYDMGVMFSIPASPAHERAFELIRRSFTATGKDARAGASMPHYFMQAGVGFPDGTQAASFLAPSARLTPAAAAVLTSLAPTLDKLGLASKAEITDILASMQTAAQNPEASARGPDLIASWKRKLK